ncbi:hypothetical protein [Methylocystis echinoides]|jgi:flagellar motility protein MotE (MotC chaperone)|uniref:hypothetical protein n=1 Tax=Methylocystis echinoides TaxID=29468 RepID=UPI003423EE90
MNIHDVSAYLLRFDEPPRLPPPTPILETLFEPSIEGLGEEPAPESVAPPSVDLEALRSAFDEELAAALEQQQAAHEESLRQARTQWIEQQGDVLARRLSETLAQAFDALRGDVARILAPFVAREVEQTTVDELTDSIRRAIADDSAPAIRLEGPRDLIEKMAETFAAQQAAAILTESDGVDVTVDFGLTRIETRLEAWMRRLCDSRSYGS